MSYDRDYTTVKGKPRLHTTLQRDWVCGTCGGRLVLRWFEEAPNWRTVCFDNPTHEPDGFVHSSSWAYREDRQRMEAMTADHIFKQLPDELQESILANQ